MSLTEELYAPDQLDREPEYVERAVKERPILFSGPMVRALLEGRKTQTRRPVKPPKCATIFGRQPAWDLAWVDPGGTIFGPGPYLKLPYGGGDYPTRNEVEARVFCPYGAVGERLWVKETHQFVEAYDGPGVCYRADDQIRACVYAEDDWECIRTPIGVGKVLHDYGEHPWRPSLFMPRWASRLTLEITGVRVERLQEISEGDAAAEGSHFWAMETDRHIDAACRATRALDPAAGVVSRRGEFRALWETIHGPGSWDISPWVWVIEFRRVTE